MAANVSAQFGQLNRSVVTFSALVRLLVGVLVAHVTDQLTCGQPQQNNIQNKYLNKYFGQQPNTRRHLGLNEAQKTCIVGTGQLI